MSLTAMYLQESARRKFFMNSTYIISWKWESNVFSLRRPKWILQQCTCTNRRKENFSWTRRTSCPESRNPNILGSGGRNESNSNVLAGIGEKKIFHELDVHHVEKVGIKRFWAQEAEMSLIAMSLLESARSKFFMNSTYIMSRKWESNVLVVRRAKWAQEAEMSLTAMSLLESAGRKFFMNSTYIMSRK